MLRSILGQYSLQSCTRVLDYPFAKYNIQPISFVYSQDEYTRLLEGEPLAGAISRTRGEQYEDQEWTKEETDYLFELVREYDQRWHIVHDRYEYIGGSERSLEVCLTSFVQYLCAS